MLARTLWFTLRQIETMLMIQHTFIVQDLDGKLVRLHQVGLKKGIKNGEVPRFFIENFDYRGSVYSGLKEISLAFANELAAKTI